MMDDETKKQYMEHFRSLSDANGINWSLNELRNTLEGFVHDVRIAYKGATIGASYGFKTMFCPLTNDTADFVFAALFDVIAREICKPESALSPFVRPKCLSELTFNVGGK
jgi:hypothetical protein